MLANLRRKIGMQSIQPTPTMGGDLVGPYGDPQPTAATNFSLEDFGFSWPDGVFSPTNIPMWLQEAVWIFVWLLAQLANDMILEPFGSWHAKQRI